MQGVSGNGGSTFTNAISTIFLIHLCTIEWMHTHAGIPAQRPQRRRRRRLSDTQASDEVLNLIFHTFKKKNPCWFWRS